MRLGLGLGVNKGRKNNGIPQDAAITALLDQASSDGYTPFSGNTLTAANVLVTSLKSSGIWDKLDLFYVFATNGDRDFACYNWIDPSTFFATETGAGALTFTANEGFTGDGTNYLNTQYNASTSSTNFTQNSASYGFYTRTNSNVRGQMGTEGSALNFAHARTDTSSNFRINASGSISQFGNTDVRGFWQINRDSSLSADALQNASVFVGSDANASSPPPSANFNILKDYSFITTQQLSVGFVGGNLLSEASDFYNAVQTYMSTIGSAV